MSLINPFGMPRNWWLSFNRAFQGFDYPVFYILRFDPGSSNGRTWDFGSQNGGSNPPPGSILPTY